MFSTVVKNSKACRVAILAHSLCNVAHERQAAVRKRNAADSTSIQETLEVVPKRPT